MKLAAFLAPALLLAAAPAAAQDADPEAAAIEATARDYIEGWFTGDEARMERALSPKLAKRILAAELGVENVGLVETSALELVQQTRARPDAELTETPEVVILDRTGNAASVRVDAGDWVDYMHLAKFGGERWLIVNVLWELTPDDGGGE
jgi:hypothetical protein